MDFPPKALKPELWALAKAKAAEDPKYRVDDIIKAAGHTPLRLPPYHCDLNPIGIFYCFMRKNSNFKYKFLLQKTSRLE